MANETLRIVAMDKCQECDGEGACTQRTNDDTGWEEVACKWCNGEGVTERQITLREFRRMLEADAKAESAEMDAGRFAEVGDANAA